MDWNRLLSFNVKEAQVFLLISLISAFVLSEYRYLGVKELDYVHAANTFFVNLVVFSILYLIMLMVQKIVAGVKGYSHTFEVWQFGPPSGLLITIMSYGIIPFIYLGNIVLKPIKRLRLGYFERSTNIKDLALMGLLGPVTLVLIVFLIFEPLYFLTQLYIFERFIIVASYIILFSSLPLPYTNAVNVLVYSRFLWFFLLLFGLLSVFLINVAGLYSYVVGLGLAIFGAYVLKVYAQEKFF